MSDTMKSAEQARADEREATEAECEAKVRAYKLDNGEQLEVFEITEDHVAGRGVSTFKTSTIAGVIMGKMIAARDASGVVGPLPWRMLIQCNETAKIAGRMIDDARELARDTMLREPLIGSHEITLAHAIVQGMALGDVRSAILETAEDMKKAGESAAADVMVAREMMGLSFFIREGLDAGTEAHALEHRLSQPNPETTIEQRTQGRVSALIPVERTEDPSVTRATIDMIMGRGGPVGQA